MSQIQLASEHQVSGSMTQWDAQQVEVLRNLIAPDVSDPEFLLFGQVCKRTGLDPFAKQIYPIVRSVWNKKTKRKEPKMTIQVSIDGFRLIADRSGDYAGSETFWCGSDGQWVDVWLESSPPLAAKTTVWKRGCDRPFTGVARFSSYCQTYENKPQGQWETMPDVMIGKCSEALALRKAFPANLSGLYTTEEMQQADVEVIDAPPAPYFAAQAKEIAKHGKDNGLSAHEIQALCKEHNLPTASGKFTTKAQVDTFASLVEDASCGYLKSPDEAGPDYEGDMVSAAG